MRKHSFLGSSGKRDKATQAVKPLPTLIKEQGPHFYVEPLRQKEGEKDWWDQGSWRLDLKPAPYKSWQLSWKLAMGTGKGTSGMDEFGSVIDMMNMKLGSKFLSPLSVKTQLLKMLQCVIVVYGATHS